MGDTEQLNCYSNKKFQLTGGHTSTSIPLWKREENLF